MSAKVFYSHGKLLLTGEYVVLDGAKALALPTNKGQYLTVKPISNPVIHWKSFDENNTIWFEEEFSIDQILLNNSRPENEYISNTLIDVLSAAHQLNPDFLRGNQGFYITTKLTFKREFGLGSSSTLIANIAKWAKVNPFDLLWNSFKGSGYDLACASSNSALVYQLENKFPKIEFINFNPSFSNQIYFIYLNTKQSSREGIAHYNVLPANLKEKAISEITSITNSMLSCKSLTQFNSLVNSHENVISNLTQLPTVKEELFKEYAKGSVKSLGAWGGDFILITVEDKSDCDYFRNKGFNTIYSFDEMLLL